MKTDTHHLIIAIILAMFSFSCSGFLDEDPKDQVPEEEAQRTLQSLYRNYVAALYTDIGGYQDSQGLQGTTRGVYDLNTLTTDEAMIPTRGGDWYDGGFWQRLYLHSWGVTDQHIRATWEYLYKVITLSNKSIEVLTSGKENFDPQTLDVYIGEVRALRAIYYYYLLDLFARVPIITNSTTPTKEIQQSERAELFYFIYKELNEALPLLSEVHSNRLGEYYGRVTQPVAYFVLAKLMLNAEVYTDNEWTLQGRPVGSALFFTINEQQYNAWEAVIYYCDKITALGYTLSDTYEENFEVFNEHSPENIFTIPMDKRSYTHQMQYMFRSLHYKHAQALGFGGENGTSAGVDALHIYGYGTDAIDPRFEKNYHAGIIYAPNGQVVKDDYGKVLAYLPWEVQLDLSASPHEKMAGARMKKYAVDQTGIKDGKLIENDIVLFRYADVLLMKSEALVRNGGNGDAELNAVRARVNAPYRSATLRNIFDERLLELAWEGWRRQDMIRFETYHKPYAQRPQLVGEESGYTTVFPIPKSIIELNPNLTQHKGYTSQ